jgi:hypothetical protein
MKTIQLALAFLTTLIVLPTTVAGAQSLEPGKYSGVYRCAQGLTDSTLEVFSQPQNGDGRFIFRKGSIFGSYTVSISDNDGKIQIDPNEWERRPAGYRAVPITVKKNGNSLDGFVLSPSCGEIHLLRERADRQIVGASTGGASVVGAAQAPPNKLGTYRPKNFDGNKIWLDAFTKAVNDPPAFQTFLSGMVQTANGVNAKVYGLATGPQRNSYQKFLTDYQLYTIYLTSKTSLLDKAKQCLVERDYSAAEACDCVAGFPGDTVIGPGAGELVVSSNSALGISACGIAAAAASNPAEKARYIAQRARAQVYTTDTFQAVTWADEAIKMGYRRASIVKASAALRDFEFRNSSFPPPTQDFNREILDLGVEFLRAAKKSGVRESYIVAQQFQQAISIFKFNNSVLTPIFRQMMTPPPASAGRDDCGLRPTGVNGAGGVVYGMRCN